MKIREGRANLSTTVYVPYDCSNNCKFCTSKLEYSNKVDAIKTLIWLKRIRNSTIKEVVFTGGEPMTNLESLKYLIQEVSNKDVYINTTLLKDNLDEFCDFVNNTPCIKGVNISRHCSTYEDDCKMLNNIAEDSALKKIVKPIKINVVISDKLNKEFVDNVLNRWNEFNKYGDISVCFRENFNKTNINTLHSLENDNIKLLNEIAEFKHRSFCDVCDTTFYEYHTSLFKINFSYHRGLSTTSINMGKTLIINDIIINPNGELVYDWDGKNEYIKDLCEQFYIKDINSPTTQHSSNKINKVTTTKRSKSYICGAGIGGFC